MWCEFITVNTMFKKLLYSIILLSANKPTITEKIQYWIKLLLTFAPIAIVLKAIDVWYQNNEQFFSFILVTLVINMAVGIRFHLKMNTFDWEHFLKKNSSMFFILVVVYALLEMLRITAGDNIVGEGFKILIQISTLLYPASKALKNAYILSNKTFPPSFIMDKIYKFEKTGNVKDLLDTKNNDKNE